MSGPGWDNAEHCAKLRSRVHALSRSRWSEALRVAAEIPLPWYRVQALATVAQAAAEDQVDGVLERARREAARDADAYRRIAVLAWVIEAALDRGRTKLAERVLRDALDQSGTINPMRSRAAALELLLQEAMKLGAADARRVAEALLDVAEDLAAHPVKRWRKWGVSYFNRVAWTLSQGRRPLAEELLTARLGAARAAAVLARHGAG